MQTDQIDYRDTTLENARFKLNGEVSRSGNERMFKGKIDADELSLAHDSRKLSLQDIRSNIRLDNSHISSEGSFSTPSPPGRLAYRADHRFGDHAGVLSIKTTDPFDLDGEHARLSPILTPWPFGFDLYTGTIRLAARASWSRENRFQLSTAIEVKNSGGHYGQLVFSGLSFEHHLQLLPAIVSEDASIFRIRHIDSGVTVSNVNASLKLTQTATGSLPQLAVTDLAGELFDGSFSADDFVQSRQKQPHPESRKHRSRSGHSHAATTGYQREWQDRRHTAA